MTGARAHLECTALAPYAAHAFTTRAWMDEVTPRALDGLWSRAAEAVGLPGRKLARANQVHGAAVADAAKAAKVAEAAETATGRIEADVLVTDDPDLAVAVQTADCVPILLADTRSRLVAAVHAGWRGIAAGAPAAAVEAMKQRGAVPGDLVAAVGPAIGPCCYEVGGDVRSALRDHAARRAGAAHADGWFSERPVVLAHNPQLLAPPRPGHWCFDTWAAVRWQLLHAGLRPDQVFVAELCTASHPGWFYSYRREGTRAGRMAAVIRSGPRGSARAGG